MRYCVIVAWKRLNLRCTIFLVITLYKESIEMDIAQQIYQKVQTLPDIQAQEVLDFVDFITWHKQKSITKREIALQKLDELRGSYVVSDFNREELYDRSCLR